MEPISASKLIRNMFRSLLTTSISVMLVPAAQNVYAEYYLVYPAPNPVFDCPNCFVKKTVWVPHRVHHHRVKHHRVRHRRYIPLCVNCLPSPPPCMSCAAPLREIVQFNWDPNAYGHGRWVNLNIFDTYNPDMSTGDDDASIHPDMNIDY